MDSEVELNKVSPDFMGPLSGESFIEKERLRAASRLKYESEAQIIQKKLGDLEQIRHSLGLSRRKMAQLLLVDPSAWTRWCKNPERVPPHVYRSLQWYMALIDKNPEWHPQNSFLKSELASQTQEFAETRERVLKKIAEISELRSNIKDDVEKAVLRASESASALEANLERQSSSQMGWKILLLVNTALLLYFVIWR